MPHHYYLEPTLFTGVNSRMQIAQEEIFGPVLAVLTYDTEEEAVRIANDSPLACTGLCSRKMRSVPIASRAVYARARSRTISFASSILAPIRWLQGIWRRP